MRSNSLFAFWLLCLYCLALPCKNTADPPDKYTYRVVHSVDAPGNDIKNADTKDVNKLESICNSMLGCRGFNSNGWLKEDVSSQIPTSGCDIYVKIVNFTTVQAPILPQPQSFYLEATTITIGSKFSFFTECQSELLHRAIDRYQAMIFTHSYTGGSSLALEEFRIDVESPSEDLGIDTDESYFLNITAAPLTHATLETVTVFGAIRGLETFSQLVTYNFSSNMYEIRNATWLIHDGPRFQHRGLMIDTARHFQPLRVIKSVLDSMSYVKFNVLHWHIVDTQSFPLQSHSYPNLWNGAYSPQERYLIEDVKDIVAYAKDRGIRVLAEFDMPGHAASWCIGYPEICPSPDCPQPLNPANNATFKLIDGFLMEASGIFTDGFLHLGGDEVNTKCWDSSPAIQAWMKMKNFTDNDAYKYFIMKAHQSAKSAGKVPVNWEEVFNHFGTDLDNDTVIHVWLNKATAAKVVAAGYRCILSNSNEWYLPHLEVTWETFYSNDPLAKISDPKQQKLMLGGEACMWGETVDGSDIQQTVWPRAAAAAERLWSSANVTDLDHMLVRLESFRCLLTQRGIAAGPVNSEGRSAPYGPGSCSLQ